MECLNNRRKWRVISILICFSPCLLKIVLSFDRTSPLSISVDVVNSHFWISRSLCLIKSIPELKRSFLRNNITNYWSYFSCATIDLNFTWCVILQTYFLARLKFLLTYITRTNFGFFRSMKNLSLSKQSNGKYNWTCAVFKLSRCENVVTFAIWLSILFVFSLSVVDVILSSVVIGTF